ncbi:MAG: bifunctional diaminohydroxyphosphoribosylaminopyrimidine deaminase/5-amino-6-(5-phosphoribosylamino)uracil reductase RibD [Chthoniobacterales bacterium]
MTNDQHLMRQAIALAKRGAGKTLPNPAVGCLIVKRGKILGAGWHRRAGGPHAEIVALRSLAKISSARGATAYITLEPCSTSGKTPPCTGALVEAGFARIVVGATDPNPKHRGRGLRLLRRAGLTVDAGVLADECAELNPAFNHFMTTGLPWVIAKCGMSLDGRLTRPPGEGPWITSTASRRDAMKLRARVDAILVGAATVRADDPALTLRGRAHRAAPQPWRVVWAPRRMPPKTARVFQDAARDHTILFRDKSLRSVLKKLAARGILNVLVEGGGHTLGKLFHAGLANEVVFYVAPLLTGGAVSAVAGRGFRSTKLVNVRYTKVGADLKITGQTKA